MTEKDTTSELFKGMRRFRAILQAGELPLGVAVSFNDPLLSDALADSVDFFWYDLEHINLDPAALNAHLLAARGKQTAAIVRVADVHPAVIKPVLDAGADGVVAAQVRSVDEVQQLVSNCLYPPDGTRGAAPRVPSNYDRIGRECFRLANETIFTAVMIETAEALEAIEEIVRVPRLDSVVIGPLDLSGALGDLGDLDSTVLGEAMDRIIGAARETGVYVGAGVGISGDLTDSLIARGVNWLQAGCDFQYLIDAVDETVAAIRGRME